MASSHSQSATAERPAHLGHHYDSLQQQYSSGKLGMWLFLATEVLLFAGLFCAYAVYRRAHPEVFAWGHQFLDWRLGAINTLVLIFSSFTMAYAVRAAQLGKRSLLISLLVITFLCGCGFMGIKSVEYSQKWQHGYLWGTLFNPGKGHGEGHGEDGSDAAGEGAHGSGMTGEAVQGEGAHGAAAAGADTPNADADPTGTAAGAGADAASTAAGAPGTVRSSFERAAVGPAGLAAPVAAAPAAHGDHTAPPPRNAHWFFGIYFVMTGLHGLHVLIGMIVIGWLIVRSYLGHFGVQYFTPVDLGGLYWHLVDLIWIFLFPLLYLIH